MNSGFALPRIYGENFASERGAQIPRVPWDRFTRDIFQWRQGEHVGLIGPTGQGKTTLSEAILPLHKYVSVFATKPRDTSMDHLIQSEDYIRLDKWRSLDPDRFPKRVVWPDATQLDSTDKQRDVFHDAFKKIYREGHWTLNVDELWYFTQVLRLGEDVKLYLLQARSLHISLVGATQRPSWVPRETYTQSTHLFFWRTNDETDLASLSGIGFLNSRLIKATVARLERFQCLYINTRTGRMCRTKAPAPIVKDDL